MTVMPTYSESELEEAHEHSFNHRDEIASSSSCGCFYCGEKFAPSQIQGWTVDDTAIRPNCGIDSVLGSSAGYKLEDELLEAMHEYWFDRTKTIDEIVESEDLTIIDDGS